MTGRLSDVSAGSALSLKVFALSSDPHCRANVGEICPGIDDDNRTFATALIMMVFRFFIQAKSVSVPIQTSPFVFERLAASSKLLSWIWDFIIQSLCQVTAVTVRQSFDE